MKKLKRFLYLDPVTEAPLMIIAKTRPSLLSQPKSGTWVIREFYSGTCGTHKWDIPCFPEITWPVLKKLIFVGEIKTTHDLKDGKGEGA